MTEEISATILVYKQQGQEVNNELNRLLIPVLPTSTLAPLLSLTYLKHLKASYLSFESLGPERHLLLCVQYFYTTTCNTSRAVLIRNLQYFYDTCNNSMKRAMLLWNPQYFDETCNTSMRAILICNPQYRVHLHRNHAPGTPRHYIHVYNIFLSLNNKYVVICTIYILHISSRNLYT